VTLKTEPETCRWKGCLKAAPSDAWFCADHAALAATPPPGKDRLAWVSNLAYVVSTGVAGSAVYDVLKSLIEHKHIVGLSDPLQERIEVILKAPSPTSVRPVQHYVDLSADPEFVGALSALTAITVPKAPL
jgi:hypothetical protein